MELHHLVVFDRQVVARPLKVCNLLRKRGDGGGGNGEKRRGRGEWFV